jgi:hypothetical protein
MAGRSAFHIRRSTLNVRCLPAFGGARGDQGSMFKLLRLQLRLNLHITLKLHIQVRSSELCENAQLGVVRYLLSVSRIMSLTVDSYA